MRFSRRKGRARFKRNERFKKKMLRKEGGEVSKEGERWRKLVLREGERRRKF